MKITHMRTSQGSLFTAPSSKSASVICTGQRCKGQPQGGEAFQQGRRKAGSLGRLEVAQQQWGIVGDG